MKKSCILLFFCVFMVQLNGQEIALKQTEAAKHVMERVLGEAAKAFRFVNTEQNDGLDSYEVHAKNGKVTVFGSGTIAMCHGAYDYLRKACHFQYTWSSNLAVPTVFPDFDIAKITSPYKMRQYYNVCTYGYSTAFWGWDEWQRELDWMALHGINMPIAMIGQEAIWQKVWKSYGISDAELDAYYTGPAFLPWHRMGNVNKHGGPVPKSYFAKSVILQKQLLQRMRELGMMPIVPAFSGYVPDVLKRVMPEVGILDMKPWCGFDKDYGTHMLLPDTKRFTEIGKKFIEEYTKEFGPCKYYLADAFNEMTVPVKNDRYKELSDFGRAIYQSIHQADSNAIWVMQGWLFFNDKGFWDKPSVQAFLKDVPDNKMIIIDLANESFHGWQEQNAFYGKNWICSYIHNYGGKTQLGGNLALFAGDAPKMLANPAHGKLCGFGISPEGINQNEVVYELLTDVAWADKPIDLDQWIDMWSKSRYGFCNPEIKKAWNYLLKSVYGNDGYHAPNLYQLRPSLNLEHQIYMPDELDSVFTPFANKGYDLLNNEMINNDGNEIEIYMKGIRIDFYLNKAIQYFKNKEFVKSKAMFERAFYIMHNIKNSFFINSKPELAQWVELAKNWGNNNNEKDYYEEQAKRQITVWGGPVLSEYACKTWSGLIYSYYLPRWQIFYNHLFNNGKDTIQQWEEKWITTAASYSKLDTVKNNMEINSNDDYMDLDKYKNYINIYAENQKSGKFLINIDSKDKNLDIFYTTDGSTPTIKSLKYKKPFDAKPSMIIKAQPFKNDEEYGEEAELKLSLSLNKIVILKEAADGRYKAKGAASLTDGIFGTSDYKDGKWLGFEGKNMEAKIDLGSVQVIHNIGINYLVNTNSWIFAPTSFSIEVSDDDKSYKKLSEAVLEYKCSGNDNQKICSVSTGQNFRTRYVKIKAISPKICPEDHPGAGQKCWIFIDEITIK
ncbi:MAG: alpha-N-acetylglucosaminidase C-terminal domain-containing protein [Bacteroidetes bacterium]|nr:alpha-N-acetylglucosaminidase C-terminal domain-containing protein [Bacteroidota bacterium]